MYELAIMGRKLELRRIDHLGDYSKLQMTKLKVINEKLEGVGLACMHGQFIIMTGGMPVATI